MDCTPYLSLPAARGFRIRRQAVAGLGTLGNAGDQRRRCGGHGNTSEGQAYWLLSLFHPAASDTVEWSQGNYTLTTRGGRVESDARWGDHKKQTRMVAEGSVLVAATEPRGSAADVAPEGFPHPVYRAGFALTIPIPLVRPAS